MITFKTTSGSLYQLDTEAKTLTRLSEIPVHDRKGNPRPDRYVNDKPVRVWDGPFLGLAFQAICEDGINILTTSVTEIMVK